MPQNSPPNLVVGTNSYALHSEAEIYFAGRLEVASWTALTSWNQYRALITASRKISFEVMAEFKLGTIATPSALLKDATFEMALYLAADTANVDLGNTSSNIKKLVADTVEVEFFKPVQGQTFPPLVMKFLVEAGVLSSIATSSGGMLASGVTDVSSFDTCDILERTTGLGS